MQLIMSLSACHEKARSAAAQAMAKVAKIDVPDKEWKEVIPGLCYAAMEADIPHDTKIAALLAIGYLCYEIVSESWSGDACALLHADVTSRAPSYALPLLSRAIFLPHTHPVSQPTTDSIETSETIALVSAIVTNMQATASDAARHRAVVAMENALDFVECVAQRSAHE